MRRSRPGVSSLFGTYSKRETSYERGYLRWNQQWRHEKRKSSTRGKSETNDTKNNWNRWGKNGRESGEKCKKSSKPRCNRERKSSKWWRSNSWNHKGMSGRRWRKIIRWLWCVESERRRSWKPSSGNYKTSFHLYKEITVTRTSRSIDSDSHCTKSIDQSLSNKLWRLPPGMGFTTPYRLISRNCGRMSA